MESLKELSIRLTPREGSVVFMILSGNCYDQHVAGMLLTKNIYFLHRDKPYLLFFDLTQCISVVTINELLSGDGASGIFTCPTPQVCLCMHAEMLSKQDKQSFAKWLWIWCDWVFWTGLCGEVSYWEWIWCQEHASVCGLRQSWGPCSVWQHHRLRLYWPRCSFVRQLQCCSKCAWYAGMWVEMSRVMCILYMGQFINLVTTHVSGWIEGNYNHHAHTWCMCSHCCAYNFQELLDLIRLGKCAPYYVDSTESKCPFWWLDEILREHGQLPDAVYQL